MKLNQAEKRLAREYNLSFTYQYLATDALGNSNAPKDEQSLEMQMQSIADTLPQLPQQELAFAKSVLLAVFKNFSDIKDQIEMHLKNWKFSRVAKMDLSLVFLGITELKYIHPATPTPVVINEYIELAKKFGNEDSPKFINGILDAIGKQC